MKGALLKDGEKKGETTLTHSQSHRKEEIEETAQIWGWEGHNIRHGFRIRRGGFQKVKR